MSIQPADVRPSHSTTGFILTIVAIALAMAASTASSPFYPQIQDALHLDIVQITLVFAVYPAGLLATLLVAGSLCDHLGRRPVAFAGLLMLAVSLALFAWGDSLGILLVARILQGIATALVVATVSTYMAELAPPALAGHVALANAAGPAAGLAIGAVFGGIMLDLASPALTPTFSVMIVLIVVIAALVWLLPEVALRRPGVVGSLLPRLRVPRAAAPTLLRVTPAIIASWGTGGLFISLGAHIAAEVFEAQSHTLQGATVGILAASATAATIALWRWSSRTLLIIGALALAAGTLASIVAVLTASALGYFAIIVVIGVGFGLSYAGSLRLVLPHVAREDRAGLFSVIYVIAYLSFSVPAVIAGALISLIGLIPAIIGYGVLVSAFALVALVALLVQRPGAARAQDAPEPSRVVG
ncbi:MFS transporter [Microbacterium sp. ARD32]|uniref:MFS transporter n=1 Tax=Microbacterium sp. ARD32 TaxID=2962577 RepID=UPI00288110F4|nr:MFS transporter [Microbacterium sp. ARD32]MDT0156194.1 MFS transporter [Microbacterium sp. ARD32]